MNPSSSLGASLEIPPNETFPFGPHKMKAAQLFYLTPLSYASVGLAPVLPNHCLVIPRRIVPRVSELTPEELTDIWLLAQKISQTFTMKTSSHSFTFAIQDGVDAGQTVSHVHIHILPRFRGDFKNNDDIYSEIEKGEKKINKAATAQTEELQKQNSSSSLASSASSDVVKTVHVDAPKRRYRTDAEMHDEATKFRVWMKEFESSQSKL